MSQRRTKTLANAWAVARAELAYRGRALRRQTVALLLMLAGSWGAFTLLAPGPELVARWGFWVAVVVMIFASTPFERLDRRDNGPVRAAMRVPLPLSRGDEGLAELIFLLLAVHARLLPFGLLLALLQVVHGSTLPVEGLLTLWLYLAFWLSLEWQLRQLAVRRRLLFLVLLLPLILLVLPVVLLGTPEVARRLFDLVGADAALLLALALNLLALFGAWLAPRLHRDYSPLHGTARSRA